MNSNSYRDEIVVFIEFHGNRIEDVSLELLSKASQLGRDHSLSVSSILLGTPSKDLIMHLTRYGSQKIYLVEDPALNDYHLLAYTHIISEMLKKIRPSIFLMGATPLGMELAPRVAARLRTGLSAHCIDLSLDEDGNLIQSVAGFGGQVIAMIVCPEKRPQMATVMPGVFQKIIRSSKEYTVDKMEFDLSKILQNRPKKIGEEKIEVKSYGLEKAEVIVAGGFGLGSKQNWALLEELAKILGGAVGATRPAVDEGWAEEGQMIGQSGIKVKPKLYIGVGISGQMHHVVGMDESGYIISINNDPNAEIFNVSDMIIVKDFKDILPLLIEELKKRLQKFEN